MNYESFKYSSEEGVGHLILNKGEENGIKKDMSVISSNGIIGIINQTSKKFSSVISILSRDCLLYTSDAADERSSVDLGGRRIIKK